MRWSMREFNYSPAQVRMFRAVAGAVMNAAHGHPDWGLDRIKARSIAKRAAGTLTSQWGSVLAAPSPSEKATALLQDPSRPASDGTTSGTRGASVGRGDTKPLKRRSPFKLAHGAIGRLAGEAKRAGQVERHAALADALRVLAAVRRMHEGRAQ